VVTKPPFEWTPENDEEYFEAQMRISDGQNFQRMLDYGYTEERIVAEEYSLEHIHARIQEYKNAIITSSMEKLCSSK
jgi:hypothetical protein